MAKSLFDKTYIGKMKLKNRIFMSPMGTTGEADGAYCNEGIDYFEERAKGGAGLIITGANVVSTKYEPRPCTELSDFHHVERLNMLIERCHAYGAKVCVQLSPGLGRQQFTDPFTPPYSAGSVGAFWFPDLICKPFSKEDIHYLVEKVGYSASLAVNAGACTPAVENIIEANTYLSGIGFESGGIAAAHAIHNGLTCIEETHGMYHGEKVAFGVLSQLVLENVSTEDLEEVVEFCINIGLPVTFEELGIKKLDEEKLMEAATLACAEGDTAHNMPFEVTPESVYNAMLAADRIGHYYKDYE